jgi:hypothetical protein
MANVLASGTVWDARSDLVTFEKVTYPRGVQRRPLKYLIDGMEDWAMFEAPDGSEKVYEKWAAALKSQEGKPYDKLGILDFATGLFTGRYKDKNYACKESAAWFCDEYSVWAAGQVGLIPWPIPVAIYTLTPGAALNLFLGAGWNLVGARY